MLALLFFQNFKHVILLFSFLYHFYSQISYQSNFCVFEVICLFCFLWAALNVSNIAFELFYSNVKHCICSFYNLLGFMNLGIDAFHHFNFGEIFFKIFLFSLLEGPHLHLFWSFVFFITSNVSYSFFALYSNYFSLCFILYIFYSPTSNHFISIISRILYDNSL